MPIEDRVQIRVVIHLHLAIEFEAPFALKDLVPKLFETTGEVGPLLFEQEEPLRVPQTVSVGSCRPPGLFPCVIDLEREDGEAVEDEVGGFGV